MSLRSLSFIIEDDIREVSSEGTFSFKGPAILLDGQGMTMNLDSQKVWVKKKVRMTLYHSFLKSHEREDGYVRMSRRALRFSRWVFDLV